MGKLLNDIFSMKFDIIIPISSSIVAVLLAALVFGIRFFSYRRNKRRYQKKIKREREAASVETVSDDIQRSEAKKFGS